MTAESTLAPTTISSPSSLTVQLLGLYTWILNATPVSPRFIQVLTRYIPISSQPFSISSLFSKMMNACCLQMLVLAENRILRIDFPRNGTKSEPEMFFDPGETILGFAVSISSSSVYITVKDHGLYAYNMIRQQLWIAEPKTERFGYRLGCRKDYENCKFDSPPVIDSCEASIYVTFSFFLSFK